MLPIALSGALIALSFAAPPGPVLMETVRRGLRGGFAPALNVQLGSILGDLAWCAAALLGLAPLAQIGWVRLPLGVAGVGLLAYLGAIGIRDALKHGSGDWLMPEQPADPRKAPGHGAFRSGAAISFANPMAVGYWLSVGGALAAAGAVGQSAAQTGWFVAGFLVGTLAWALLVATAIRWGKGMFSPVVFRAIHFVCGLALLFFGVGLAGQMVL